MMKHTGKPWKKILIIAGSVLACLLVGVLLTVGVLWGNEIRTLTSIKTLALPNADHGDGYVYEMNVSGDYFFDEFLAEGGASSDSELIDFIIDHLTKGIIPLTIKESQIGCSSFTAATAEGDRLFARNYDFDSTNTCLVYTNPGHGRHASVSTVDLQFVGIDPERGISGLGDKFLCLAAPFVPLDGMNDAGLCCGIYMSYQGAQTVPTDQQTERPDLTSTTMLRLILDYASTVDEAIELASNYDLHDSAGTSYHYMIADAQGNSAVLEWVAQTDTTDNDGAARQLRVIKNTSDDTSTSANFQCVTNYILTPGYYSEEEQGERHGADRYQHLTEALHACAGVLEDESAAMKLLAQVGRRTWLDENGTTNGLTVHSVIYNMTDKTVVWIGNEHYDEPDRIFNLSVPNT